MSKILAVLGGCLLLAGIFAQPAGAVIVPTFEPFQTIPWGSGQVIQAGNNGVIPNVGDWDCDGVKDLMVGVYSSGGNLYYYHNTGTSANPIFPARELVYADDVPISATYG
jgi:hypothetical protein